MLSSGSVQKLRKVIFAKQYCTQQLTKTRFNNKIHCSVQQLDTMITL